MAAQLYCWAKQLKVRIVIKHRCNAIIGKVAKTGIIDTKLLQAVASTFE